MNQQKDKTMAHSVALTQTQTIKVANLAVAMVNGLQKKFAAKVVEVEDIEFSYNVAYMTIKVDGVRKSYSWKISTFESDSIVELVHNQF